MFMDECTLFAPEEEVTLETASTLIQSDRFKKLEKDCAYKGFSKLFEEKMKVLVAKVSPDRWMEAGLHWEDEEGPDDEFSIEEYEGLE